MSLSQLIPLTATILAPVAERFSERVAEGLSFATLFRDRPAADEGTTDDSLDGSEASDAGALEIAATRRSEHLSRFAEQELTRFLDNVRAKFEEHQIGSNLTIQLKTSVDGEIHVDGDHPQRAEIESLFRSDPQLTAAFGRVSAAYSAIERQGDPYSSIDREFRLTLVNGQPSIQFE